MGKVADIKTKETNASVEEFINAMADEVKRKDSFTLIQMMKDATGEEPKMWGGSLIGFGNKRYKSPASGREVDWFIIGFSPGKRPSRFILSLIYSNLPGTWPNWANTRPAPDAYTSINWRMST